MAIPIDSKCFVRHYDILDANFPMPQKVIHHIETLCMNYLWTNTEETTKKAPIAWDTVCNPKEARGTNIVSLKEWNQATIGKLLWNLQAKANKLWMR